MRSLSSLAALLVLLPVLWTAGPGGAQTPETTEATEAEQVFFANESGGNLFLRVRPSAGEDACLDDGYRTVELPEGEERAVDLEDQAALCWCAVERPRDSCAFPEIATGGETVVVEGPEEG